MTSEPKWDRKIFTIPNMLSLLRLLMIPAMIYFYLKLERPIWTIVVLGLSGLTDIADGKIARKFQMVSDLGKMLDPVADKLTQFALFACLMVQHPQLVYVFVVLCVKEIIMASVGLLVIKRTRKVNSSVWHGKLCTVVLYFSLLLLFLLPDISEGVVWGMTVCCITVICCSFLLYMFHYQALLSAQKRQK